MSNATTTTRIPGNSRPCSIREDGHRARATHKVSSLVYGHGAGIPQGRLFCAKCAKEEVEFLAEMGYDSRLAEVVYFSRIRAA